MSKYLKDSLLHPMSWQAKGGIMETKANGVKEMESFTVALYLPKLPTNTGQGYLYGNQTPKSFSVQFKYTNQGPLAYFVDNEGLTAVLQCLEPCKLYCVTFNKGTAIAYADGVKVGELTGLKTTQTVINAMGQGMRMRGVVVNSLRVFNSALTQTQVEQLYNQGRCDEVVLGSEWKQGKSVDNTKAAYGLNSSSLGTLLKKSDKLNGFVGDYYRMDSVVTSSCYMFSNVVFNAIKNARYAEYKIRYRASVDIRIGDSLYKLRIPTNTDSALEYTFIVDVQSINPGNQFPFFVDGVGSWCEIEIISVKTIDIINEYLPQNLTQTKWIDSGVSRLDLTALNPSFTEINYQDLTNKKIIADTAPNKAPEFIGQKWLDTSTGAWYQSNGLKINNWLTL